MNYQLVQEQRLKLTITPELKQSIHMLTLSGYDLFQYVREQMMDNPVVEIDDWPDVYASPNAKVSRVAQFDPFRNVRTAEQTLEENVRSQLRLLRLTPEVYKIAAYMAGNLNDSGYLEMTVTDICRDLNVGSGLVEIALKKLQSVEPAGVGGRDLREVLLLQIDRDPAPTKYAYEIVDYHLPALAAARLDRIMSALRITRDEAEAAFRYIRNLNPRPGLSVGGSNGPYVIPDAVIERHSDGFTVAMHPTGFPRLTISPEYREWMKLPYAGEVSTYLNSQMRAAQWMIRSIEMRKRTLSVVIYAIMEEQQRFLSEGIKGLRPLNLKAVSSKLNMHESTVSRAVNDKFVLTPYGVFSLKFFFSPALETVDGSGASSRKVKARIKELIASENKARPFSDQIIAEMLGSEGIRVSRRTVTKYREELNIVSSSRRKCRV